LFVALSVLVPAPLFAQQGIERRLADLEQSVAALRAPAQQHGPSAGVLFLFGAFCALWAQNTNRSAWLWFFLGLLFSVLAVLVLLAKNAEDRSSRQETPAPV
jgi:hypothetical protein